ncbi:MAG: hypothetical protein LBS21_03540 [Clostridiales bacterium]|jgi:hypothetical protein|nr:hypothetical protein [Clostridiales bacterium]
MRNKKLIAALIIAAVVLALAGTAFANRNRLLLRFAPDKYMLTAFTNTANALKRDVIKLPDFSKYNFDSYEFDFSTGLRDFNFGSMPEEMEPLIEGIKLATLGVNTKFNRTEKKINNTLAITAGGISLTEFELFISEDLYALRNDKLYDKTITINPKTFLTDWDNSPFFSGLAPSSDLEDLDFEKINSMIFEQRQDNPFDDELLTQTALQAFEFITSPEVKYLGSNATVLLSEQTEVLNAIEARYSNEAVNSLYNSMAQSFLSAFDKAVSSQIEYAPDEETAALMKEEFERIKETVLSANFESEYLVITFFTDNDGIIRMAQIGTGDDAVIAAQSEKINVKFKLELSKPSGDARFGDEMLYEAAVSDSSSEENSFTIRGKNNLTNSNESRLYQNFTADIYINNEDVIKNNFEISWVPEDEGEFSVLYDINSSDENINLKLDGELTANEDGFAFRNGNFNITWDEYFLELKAGMSLAKYDGEVSFSGQDTMPFTDLNMLEVLGIYQKANELFTSF